MRGKRRKILTAVICLTLSVFFSQTAFADEEYTPGERTSTTKTVTVACFDTQKNPIRGCQVRFNSGTYRRGCTTASTGACQIFLDCCRPGDGFPLNWSTMAISAYGKVYGSDYYTNCGWTCGEPDYKRFTFEVK